MSGTPLFMQATTGDAAPAFSAMDFRRLVQAVHAGERVLTAAAFRVHQRAAGPTFAIEIDPGQAVVAGDDVANQGNYLCTSTAVETLTVPAAPTTGTRTHRVVLQVRDRLHGTYPANPYQWTIDLLPDTGAGLPALPASALDLATVSVASGQTSVTDANITSTRIDYTPVTTSTVTSFTNATSTAWADIPASAWPTANVWVPPSGNLMMSISVYAEATASASAVIRAGARFSGANVVAPTSGPLNNFVVLKMGTGRTQCAKTIFVSGLTAGLTTITPTYLVSVSGGFLDWGTINAVPVP
jgi:hypothetical protein